MVIWLTPSPSTIHVVYIIPLLYFQESSSSSITEEFGQNTIKTSCSQNEKRSHNGRISHFKSPKWYISKNIHIQISVTVQFTIFQVCSLPQKICVKIQTTLTKKYLFSVVEPMYNLLKYIHTYFILLKIAQPRWNMSSIYSRSLSYLKNTQTSKKAL